MTANRPVHEFKLAKVRATIWCNQDAGRSWYSVAITRSYRVGEEWKETTSFQRDDLPLVSKAADLAYAWIWQAKTREASHADA